MAFPNDMLRRAPQFGSMLPAGPDIQPAPMAMAAPPNLNSGAGAPGLMPWPDQPAPAGGGLSGLGAALGTFLGGKVAPKPKAPVQADSPMPKFKPPFPQLGPPYETV